jgi:hypothetical protein
MYEFSTKVYRVAAKFYRVSAGVTVNTLTTTLQKDFKKLNAWEILCNLLTLITE